MIPHRKDHTAILSGLEGDQEFTLEMSPHMASLLSDKLYSDKVTAVLREYGGNAQDSNIEAGNPSPIYVHLPTLLEPWVSITDEGVGLTYAELGNLFCRYGGTTKQHANNTTGMFGVGSKAWAAYSDQCTITATKDGITENVSCYKDEDGMPKFVRLSETTATPNTANGVTVQIPVKPEDVQDFEEKAKKVFSFYKVRPIFNVDIQLSLEGDIPLLVGTNWEGYSVSSVSYRRYYTPGKTKLYVVMGNVGYLTEFDNVLSTKKLDMDWAKGLTFLITVPIGTVDVAASREELSFNPQTIKFFEDLIPKIKKEVKVKVGKEFTTQNCKWNKYVLYHTLTKQSSGLAGIVANVFEEYKYLTSTIPGISFTLLDDWTITRRSRTVALDYVKQVRVNSDTEIIINNSASTQHIYERIKHIHAQIKGDNYIYVKAHGVDMQDILTDLGSPSCPVHHLDLLDPSEYGKGGTNSTGITDRQKPANLLQFNRLYVNAKAHEKECFDRIEESDVHPTTDRKFYVRIKDYRVDHPTLSNKDVGSVLDRVFPVLGIDRTHQVFAISSSRKDWFALQDDGWENVSELFDEWVQRNCRGANNFRRTLRKLGEDPLRGNLHTLLTTLINYDILKVESDPYLRCYLKAVEMGSMKGNNILGLILSSFLPLGIRKKFNYYIGDRHDRCLDFMQHGDSYFKDKYPIIHEVTKGYGSQIDGDDLLNHLKLYMEKINE
jgi:hypothetical protein